MSKCNWDEDVEMSSEERLQLSNNKLEIAQIEDRIG